MRETPAWRSARAALSEMEGRTWLVGGGLRDVLLGRNVSDLDLVTAAPAAAAARRLARAARAHVFPLSERHGAWRVIARDRSWQIDVVALRGASIEADLGMRDFTVNALAAPLDDPERIIDPHGGIADLERKRLRAVTDAVFGDDPARVMRLVRQSCELGFTIEPETADLARRDASLLDRTSVERVRDELSALLALPDPTLGLTLADDLEAMEHVLPELGALKGVTQSPNHHLDVYEHTLEVVRQARRLVCDPREALGEPRAGVVSAALAMPLAEGLTRGHGLIFAALLHDIAKPQTRTAGAGGRIGFRGHDRLGAGMAREILGRLHASHSLAKYVASLTLHHLRLGFLVDERPVSLRSAYAYLDSCEPFAVEVTVLSVADRLATRGPLAGDGVIAAHMAVAHEMIDRAASWRRDGPPDLGVRGDELADLIGREPGPWLAQLIGRLREAKYANEVSSRAEILELAIELAGAHGGGAGESLRE